MPPLLEVNNLKKYYRGGRKTIRAVDGVSFSVKQGETLALVGESGCGKTTLAKAIVRLLQPNAGEIWFDSVNLTTLNDPELAPFRRRLQYVFQNPYSSLNPAMNIYQNISRGMKIHRRVQNETEARERAEELMLEVQLSPHYLDRFPHEFSGGQRQRVAIARALAVSPDLIVLDEPTASLDVSVQAQILNLLSGLQQKFGCTYIFITHNMIIARHISDRIGIMYYGRLMEMGETEQIFLDPQHPYTKALLSAIPPAYPGEKKQRIILEGPLPDPSNLPAGCRFASRCPVRVEQCELEEPQLFSIEGGGLVRCYFPGIAIPESREDRNN